LPMTTAAKSKTHESHEHHTPVMTRHVEPPKHPKPAPVAYVSPRELATRIRAVATDIVATDGHPKRVKPLLDRLQPLVASLSKAEETPAQAAAIGLVQGIAAKLSDAIDADRFKQLAVDLRSACTELVAAHVSAA
jgi:hypothetical protein